MPERLPPKPAPIAGQRDLFTTPRAEEPVPPLRPEPPHTAEAPVRPAPLRDAEAPLRPAPPSGRARIYSVGELTREIKGVLGGRFLDVRVRGEVSNLKASGAGHLYFTLKDGDACLAAVLFRNEA